jgi:hypothetical protein
VPTFKILIEIPNDDSESQIIPIHVESDLTLKDYIHQINTVMNSSPLPLTSLSTEYHFYLDHTLLDQNEPIINLGIKDGTILQVKSKTPALKDEIKLGDDTTELAPFELGVQLFGFVPEKFQPNLVINQSTHPTQQSIKARLDALASVFECDENWELDEEFLQKIHRTCKGDEYPDIKAEEFYDTRAAGAPFGFQLTNLSLGALSDYIDFAKKYAPLGIVPSIESDLIIKNNNRFLLSELNPKTFHVKLTLAFFDARRKYDAEYKTTAPLFFYHIEHTKTQCESVLAQIIENYQTKIAIASQLNDDNLRLAAIIECQYEILLLQGFEDLNTRTSIVILNILLMQNNFPPTCQFQPGISKKELFSVVKRGMLETLHSIEQNKSLPLTQQKLLVKSRERIEKLNDYPEPQWLIHFNPDTQRVESGESLRKVKLEERFVSPIEKLRSPSSFERRERKNIKPLSPLSLSTSQSLSCTTPMTVSSQSFSSTSLIRTSTPTTVPTSQSFAGTSVRPTTPISSTPSSSDTRLSFSSGRTPQTPSTNETPRSSSFSTASSAKSNHFRKFSSRSQKSTGNPPSKGKNNCRVM